MGVAPLDAEFHRASGDIKISFLTRMDLRTISLQRQYSVRITPERLNRFLFDFGKFFSNSYSIIKKLIFKS